MKSDVSLARRLIRAYGMQAALIALAAVLGVYLATVLLEGVLIKQALQQEATYFRDKRAEDPGFPLPNTANLTGYLVSAGTQHLPESVRDLPPGFHHLPTAEDLSVAYVTVKDGERLVLLFNARQVGELATYFGLVPLAAVLVLLYLSMWVAYRMSRRMFSPVTWLAHKVNELDPQAPDITTFLPENLPADSDQEVRVLARAISEFAGRLDAFVTRERNFTRDASHELRSPLTVIRIAAEMLLTEQELEPKEKNSVQRILRATQEMEELAEAFLMLARESEQGLSTEPVCINDVVEEELQRARVLIRNKPVEIHASADCQLVTSGSDKVLSVLIGNLLRNAVNYTDAGNIQVHIKKGEISIEDSGVGISRQHVGRVFQPFFRGSPARHNGHGVGLTIVKRLSDRFNWPVQIDSTLNVGTRVVVQFPESHCEPFAADSGSIEKTAAVLPVNKS
jgi:signal transduction histidine kinase